MSHINTLEEIEAKINFYEGVTSQNLVQIKLNNDILHKSILQYEENLLRLKCLKSVR